MSTVLHISAPLFIKTQYLFIWNQFNPKWKGKYEVLVNFINTMGCSIMIIDFKKAIVILIKRAILTEKLLFSDQAELRAYICLTAT